MKFANHSLPAALMSLAFLQPIGTQASEAVSVTVPPSSFSVQPMTMQNQQLVEKTFRQIYAAMLAADTRRLSSLLADDFQLTHMTGLVQSKAQWLADIDATRMAYHDAREVSLSTQAHGGGFRLVGRHNVDATIYGGRGRWPLQLTTDFEHRQGQWLATRMVATTF